METVLLISLKKEKLMNKNKKTKTLLPLGTILLVVGFTINTLFMLGGIGGYLREITRLTTIIGLIMVIIGLVKVVVRLFRRK